LPPVPELPLAAATPAALTFLETSVTSQERTITDPYQANKQLLEQSFKDFLRNLVVKNIAWKYTNSFGKLLSKQAKSKAKRVLSFFFENGLRLGWYTAQELLYLNCRNRPTVTADKNYSGWLMLLTSICQKVAKKFIHALVEENNRFVSAVSERKGQIGQKIKNFPTRSCEFGAPKITGEITKTPLKVGQLGSIIENIQSFNNKELGTSLTLFP
jgi:hypothetical protein